MKMFWMSGAISIGLMAALVSPATTQDAAGQRPAVSDFASLESTQNSANAKPGAFPAGRVLEEFPTR
jgi:hypothetical protein